MSLMVSLPLNGNTKNHGLLGELAVSSPTYVDGKLGKALHTGTIKMTAKQTAQVLNNNEVSIAFWVYVNADTGSDNRAMLFGNNGTSANNNRKFSLFQYPTCNDLHYSFMNDAASVTFAADVLTGVLPSYKWTHVAVVYKNPTIKIFINGELKHADTSKVSNSSSFAYDTQLIYNSEYHYFNDYRIYDNALSEREIHELSKGLVVHYPLSSNVGNNLISGMFECTSTKDSYTSSGHITVHLTAEEILANKGKTLCFSYRTNSKGTSQSIGANWQKNRFGIHGAIGITTSSGTSTHYPFAELLACSKEEGLYYTTWTIPTNMTANNGLGFAIQTKYTDGYAKPSSDNDETWWIKQVKLEWGNKPTIWCPNSNDTEYTSLGYTPNIEYDTSGLCNHGSFSSIASYSTDSPRNDGCYKFTKTSTITTTLNTTGFASTYTVSYWAKINDLANKMVFGFSDGNRLNLYPTLDKKMFCWNTDDGSANPFSNGEYAPYNDSQWHHYAITGDGTISTLYIDGTKVGTASFRPMNGSKLFINGWGRNANYQWTDGYISDFRLYTTVLSDTDIESLYNTPISITNNGTLMTQGEFKEE